MTGKNAAIFLEHILESVNDIESFSENISKEDLSKNKEKLNAIVRSIEIIGEAAKNIPDSFKEKKYVVDKLKHNVELFGGGTNAEEAEAKKGKPTPTKEQPKEVVKPAATTKPITAEEFNAKWAKLKPNETLVGPDGKTYTKGQ